MRHALMATTTPNLLQRVLLLVLVLVALTGCPKAPTTMAYVVRHAEKATAPPDDPPLTTDGQAHAQALADLLGSQPIVAVFSTDTKRTRQTAEPLASSLRLNVQIYSSTTDLAQLIGASYDGKAVVIVGHSNTVPQIITALGAAPPADIATGIPEDEFDNLYMVLISSTSAGVTALTY